jgi:hypothetical protein
LGGPGPFLTGIGQGGLGGRQPPGEEGVGDPLQAFPM